MTLTADRRIDLLASCRLFHGVTAEQLAAVADSAVDVDYPAGAVIVRQGEIGTGFFIVADGAVQVVRDGKTIATLGPGEFFGELSVLDGRPRTAQVIAETPTRCLALASWDFERVLLAQPELTLAILRGMATRLRGVTEERHQ